MQRDDRGNKENMSKYDILLSVTPTRHRNSKIKTFIKCCLLSDSHTSRHRALQPYPPQSNAATWAERPSERARQGFVCRLCSLPVS